MNVKYSSPRRNKDVVLGGGEEFGNRNRLKTGGGSDEKNFNVLIGG